MWPAREKREGVSTQDLHLQLLSCVILNNPPDLSEPLFLICKMGKMTPNLLCGLNRSAGDVTIPRGCPGCSGLTRWMNT